MRFMYFQMGIFLVLFCHVQTGEAAPPWTYDASRTFKVELSNQAPTGEASIREHSVVWHPQKRKYYLLADVVPLKSHYHPNTYETEIHLWSGPDLVNWQYHGIAVEKGRTAAGYDSHGVASPAGAVFLNGKIYVPFSARRTGQFTERSIGLAWSGKDPEQIPWNKTKRPISDLVGEDDDPALMTVPGDSRLHLYHRRTGPQSYRIVHTFSETPEISESWPAAIPVTSRPDYVRAQELTGAFYAGGQCHLFVIEHLKKGGMGIAHLVSEKPDAPFTAERGAARYLSGQAQPSQLAYSGHITPVVQGGKLVALFWTVPQKGRRYGLKGHPLLSAGD